MNLIEPLSKQKLFLERDRLRNEIIIKINNYLITKCNKLINGNIVSLDMSHLEITKAASEFVIEYFNETGEWEVSLSKQKSDNSNISDVLDFKLI